ncbi:MAG TPA: glycosyltransferase, partial [Dehalococcoidia bacterium]
WNALLAMGYNLDVWQFPNQSLSEEMKGCVTAVVTPDSLAECDPPQGEYRAIIVPFVLESMTSPPAHFLGELKKGLSAQGSVIVATGNQTRLETRLAAIAGKSFAFRRKAPRLSLSWSALPTVHLFHRDDLMNAGREAGYQVRGCQYVTSNRLFLELDVMPIEQYAVRKAGDYLQRAIPSMRDTIILELEARVPDDSAWTDDPKFVSVFVSAVNGADRLRSTLKALLEQTYPADLYEIVVVHDGSRPDVYEAIEETSGAKVAVRGFVAQHIEGPSLRNSVMAQARGQISAHTDDSCRQPADWIEAAALGFDANTAIVSGPVFALGDSDPRFLNVPGLRPEPADDEIWRDDLFPITNVFYRTGVAVAAGGFSRRFEEGEGRAAAGWDAELAWRLRRMGWQARFREEVFTFRSFPGPAGRRLRAEHKTASELPAMYAAVPELKGRLLGGLFASKSTMYFDLMLVGVALAARQRRLPWMLAALPWLGMISKRLDVWPPTQWRHTARMGARMGALHLAWLAGFIKGSIKAKKVVL